MYIIVITDCLPILNNYPNLFKVSTITINLELLKVGIKTMF